MKPTSLLAFCILILYGCGNNNNTKQSGPSQEQKAALLEQFAMDYLSVRGTDFFIETYQGKPAHISQTTSYKYNNDLQNKQEPSTIEYSFTDGRLTMVTIDNGDSAIYQYDDKNRLITFESVSGESRKRYDITRDAEGRCEHMRIFRSEVKDDRNIDFTYWGTDSMHIAYSAISKHRVSLSATDKRFTPEKGKTPLFATYGSVNDPDRAAMSMFDEQGNRLRDLDYIGERLATDVQYDYDEHGNESLNRLIAYLEDGKTLYDRVNRQAKYTYDQTGNWISRTETGTDCDCEILTTRKITY